MVYEYCKNMIGEIKEEKSSCENTHKDTKEETFLTELAKHVNKSGSLPTNPQQKSDNLGRIAGFGIGIGSLYLQEALGYPFIVLRRQCQVNHGGLKYHIQPFSLFRIVERINHRQGAGVFWKGWGSNCIVKGISIMTEVAFCELLIVPSKKETLLGKEKASVKSELLHESLKGFSCLLTLPLLSASLIDSVQSVAIDQSRSIFTFFKDAFDRIIGWYVSRGHGRLLPFRSLIVPSLVYGVINHTIKLFINRLLIRSNAQRYKIGEKTDETNMKKIYYAELMSNLISSLLTDAITYPLETVVLRLHLQGTRTIIDDTDKGIGVVPLCTSYDGMSDCLEVIMREEGPGGLYRGFGALIAQYVLQFVIVRLSKPLYCV